MSGMLKVQVLASERGDRGATLRGLRAYNVARIGPHRWTPLTLVAREGRRILGGLKGESCWEWMFVRFLWVHEERRGMGLGQRLLRLAEREARRRGCRGVWLNTFDFQAPRFYAKLGYREFGRLRDFPVRGRSAHFFFRALESTRRPAGGLKKGSERLRRSSGAPVAPPSR